jgi:pimeloyl-ACP methyl ester carboxylesterase
LFFRRLTLALVVASGLAAQASAAAPGLVDLYRSGGHTIAVVDDPYGPPRIVNLDTGEVHGLYPGGAGYRIGTGWATEGAGVGTLELGGDSARVNGEVWTHVPVESMEVRFRSGAATLAGTLMVPPGPAPHAAIAWVTGSGATTRAYLPDLQALFLRHGVAVLAYDKRGIGRSTGFYAGASPTASAIDVLARDAAAAARFLARQPRIDPRRVGLAGQSQAGWITPLAAARERAIRFLVLFSGPAVTADENDLFQNLTGEGLHPAAQTDAQIDDAVRKAGRSGFDPQPLLRKLRIPSLWLYGALDRHIPPRLSVERLRAVPGNGITIAVFPKANHALVMTRTGLTSEMLRSDTFAPGLFARVGGWLRAQRLDG